MPLQITKKLEWRGAPVQEVHEVVGGVQVGAGQRAAAEQRGDLRSSGVATLLRLDELEVPARVVKQRATSRRSVAAGV